jgi:hypothetical protein
VAGLATIILAGLSDKVRYSRTEEFTVPGTRITDQQVTIYMKHRKRNSQVIAAAKAGISERSARRIDKLDEQPLSNKRQWRTRIDPLESIWDSIVGQLRFQRARCISMLL